MEHERNISVEEPSLEPHLTWIETLLWCSVFILGALFLLSVIKVIMNVFAL